MTAGNVKQISSADSRGSARKNSIQRQDNPIRKPLGPKKDSPSANRKPICRKPSMIPKLTRPGTCGKRIDSNEKILLTDKNSLVANNTSSNSLRSKLPNGNASSSSLLTNEATNISVKMLDLKERLKQTTSLLRKKINSSTKTDGEIAIEGCPSRNNIIYSKEPKTIFQEINENVYRLETIALNVPPGCDLHTKKCLEQLLTKVNEIKEIAMDQTGNTESKGVNEENPCSKNNRYSQTKDKDNKIHIKFMQSKEKSERKLRKDLDKIPNQECATTNPSTEPQQSTTVSEDKVRVIFIKNNV